MGKEKVVGRISGKDAKIIQECAESGEPVFVLRAKDIFSVLAVRRYQMMVEEYGPDDASIITQIEEKLSEIKTWQRSNVGLVRYPD